jgi:hypothetical protein
MYLFINEAQIPVVRIAQDVSNPAQNWLNSTQSLMNPCTDPARLVSFSSMCSDLLVQSKHIHLVDSALVSSVCHCGLVFSWMVPLFNSGGNGTCCFAN